MSEPALQIPVLTPEENLQQTIGECFDQPMKYCMFAWDWDNDSSLHVVRMPEPWCDDYQSEWGLDGWQCEFMERLGEEIRKRGFDPDNPKTVMPIETAVRSGHGIGKSALVGMLFSFLLDTRPGMQGIITANTGPQLFSKTWGQVKLWKGRAITAHWWRILESKIVLDTEVVKSYPGERPGMLEAVTWNKDRPESFAGQHAVDSSSVYGFDEASAVHDKIWEVSRGGLTDGEPFHFVFGNPTRNTGEFHRCFGKRRHRMSFVMEIDSREAQITNKRLLQSWVDEYGEDSDFVRVRVRGKEPRASEDQLIPTDLVLNAMTRELPEDIPIDEPVVMSIDVARSPLGDESVIGVRRGKDFRTHGFRAYRGKNTHQLASLAAQWYEDLRLLRVPPAVIFIDGGGVGGGVIDRMLALGYPVTEVNFGGEPDRIDRYKQKDAEMWGRLKAWLASGGCLPNDDQLEEQLVSRPFGYTDKMQLYLWPKKKCKEELGLESPDRADMAALQFAFPVARCRPGEQPMRTMAETEYDPYKED